MGFRISTTPFDQIGDPRTKPTSRTDGHAAAPAANRCVGPVAILRRDRSEGRMAWGPHPTARARPRIGWGARRRVPRRSPTMSSMAGQRRADILCGLMNAIRHRPMFGDAGLHIQQGIWVSLGRWSVVSSPYARPPVLLNIWIAGGPAVHRGPGRPGRQPRPLGTSARDAEHTRGATPRRQIGHRPQLHPAWGGFHPTRPNKPQNQ